MTAPNTSPRRAYLLAGLIALLVAFAALILRGAEMTAVMLAAFGGIGLIGLASREPFLATFRGLVPVMLVGVLVLGLAERGRSGPAVRFEDIFLCAGVLGYLLLYHRLEVLYGGEIGPARPDALVPADEWQMGLLTAVLGAVVGQVASVLVVLPAEQWSVGPEWWRLALVALVATAPPLVVGGVLTAGRFRRARPEEARLLLNDLAWQELHRPLAPQVRFRPAR